MKNVSEKDRGFITYSESESDAGETRRKEEEERKQKETSHRILNDN
jgi:hypothetical protein